MDGECTHGRKERGGVRDTLETRNLVKLGRPFLKIHLASALDSTHTYTHTHTTPNTLSTLSLTGQVFTFSIHQRQKARRNRGRRERGRREKKRGYREKE